jgi:hypothetical protein
MVDRPFLRGARLTSATSIVDSSNPSFGDLVQLVRVGDIPSEDGALVEDLFVVSTKVTQIIVESARLLLEFTFMRLIKQLLLRRLP